jgi:hypothetical protein
MAVLSSPTPETAAFPFGRKSSQPMARRTIWC